MLGDAHHGVTPARKQPLEPHRRETGRTRGLTIERPTVRAVDHRGRRANHPQQRPERRAGERRMKMHDARLSPRDDLTHAPCKPGRIDQALPAVVERDDVRAFR